MVPRLTRRGLLQATGAAVATGLAGCELRHEPKTETTQTTAAGRDRTTPSYGAVGPNANETDNGTGNGADGGTATTPTKTVTPGRTFSFEVDNVMAPEELERAPGVEAGTPAVVTIDVEENWSDGTEKTLFETQFELPPETSRTFEDAFTTKRNGPSYIVRAIMEQYPNGEPSNAGNRSDARRFTPGSFNDPGGTTFRIRIADFRDDEDPLAPYFGMDVKGEQ